MASSSTSSIQKHFKYHVFLSFRGADTRTTFVDHLYASLKRLGIHTFRDNEELQKGKQIDELFKAIEESKFFIIIFSKNYASSSWCLKELTKIMECQDMTERIAYPLFHNVEPTDIRKQSGPVGRAIARHRTDKQFKSWKKALEDAGNLVGWDLKKIANGHEAEAIDQIVKEISVKLRSIYLSKDENLVGMESRMQDLELSFGKGLDDEVRMIGIKGMGGIGKTTLARAIYHKISSLFEGASFVENVREASKTRGGLLSLQQQVLRDVLKDDSMKNVQDTISMMKIRMPLKKVLLVLDDVDHKDQLEGLAGGWFKAGSRIIITTRNGQVLKAHRVNWIHNINFLSDEEAFSLFNRYAFERYIPIQGYEDLSFKLVKYAAGLPLTLKVLGSFLLGKREDAWIDTLKRLKTNPEKETLDILEISYDGLEDDQKEIFLDVACFMKGMRKEDAIRMLESCGFHAIIGLTVLEERCLITISNLCLEMHDSIQELGRNIVRRSHPREPNKHSRLWVPKEIKALLSDNAVTEAAATCIRLKSADLNPEIIMKGLGKLQKLRVLDISERHSGWLHNKRRFDPYSSEKSWRDDDCPRNNRMFAQDNFPNALQFLKWESYPGRSLLQTFQANNLVGLELPESRFLQLWESGEREVLSKLRFLNLRDSKLRILDLEITPNLERLDLEGCFYLRKIHASARCLKKLVYVNLLGCLSVRSSSFIQQLTSPELLSLAKLQVTETTPYKLKNSSFACVYLEEQASSLENSQKSVSLNIQQRGAKPKSLFRRLFGLQHLRHLTIRGGIPEFPNDLDQLANLEELILESQDIKCLPDSICMLKHLKFLKIESCFGLNELPKDLGQLVCLEKLIVCACIKHFPYSICMMKNLKSLTLRNCLYLEELPEDLGQLECIEELFLYGCQSLKEIPNSICNMNRLRYFYLPFCKQVEKLPEEVGSLECLKELNITDTGISHLPESISSLEGLRVVGSKAVLQSCVFATEIKGSEVDAFCYIKAVHNTVDNTEAGTGLENQFTENNNSIRWWGCLSGR